MNVTMEKIGNVGGIITVSIEENDYQGKVEADLKKIGQKHHIDGFRPGKVPAGILKKLFGKQVLSDVINRETVDALFKYIEDNKLSVLGEPLSAQESQEVDFSQKNFTFSFEVGLAPDFNADLNKDVTIPYYTISVDDEMVKRQDDAYARRFGKQEPGEKVDESALVKGDIVELNADGSVKEGGIATSTIISMEYVADEEEKSKFLGKVVGDKVVFNPKKASKENAAEVASMLNMDKDAAANVEADFELTVKEIIVLKLAEKNQEFFDSVFGKDVVKNEEEYGVKLRDLIAKQLVMDSNYRFTIDAQNVIMAKVGEMELPAEFLKKWLVKTNEKLTAENIEEEYNRMLPAAKWQLVKEKIAKNLGVKVTEEDIKGEAKVMAAQQFAQYGLTNLPEEYIENSANEMLQKEEYRRHLADKAVEDKLFFAIKETVNVEEKTVSVAEFNDLFKAE